MRSEPLTIMEAAMEAAENKDATTAGAEAAEIERLKDELRREHEMHMRALADFENYRRRVERDRAIEAHRAKREIMLFLVELLDSLERALEHSGDAPFAIREGLLVIHRNLLGLLGAQGITPIKSIGQPFDPALHEAVGPVQSDRFEQGIVAEEVQRGYRWGDELLRPARVRVAQ